MYESSGNKRDKNSVMESVKTARNYRDELQQLLVDLDGINSQVTKSAHESLSQIESTFDILAASLLRSIDARKQKLLAEVRIVREEAIGSLDDCRTVIDNEMKTTYEVVDLGKKILSEEGNISDVVFTEFDDKCSSMGFFPDAVRPTDFPCISVHFGQSIVEDILKKVLSFGRISVMGPVQIVESKEKPGAVAVRWEEDEVRTCCDSQNRNYRLQRCRGDVRGDESAAEYEDAYIGHETCYVVRDLTPAVSYSFRVSHYGSEECEWSMPYVAKTTVPSYEWNGANDDYFLSDLSRIASKVTNVWSILYSSGPQFRCGHSLQLKILETTSSLDNEGLGLSFDANCCLDEPTVRPGVILVNVDGYVFVDGIKMTNRLPKLNKNSLLVFESEEELTNNKMRVMITCEDKQVTYDWRLEQGSDNVYFFMFFRENGWKVSVE